MAYDCDTGLGDPTSTDVPWHWGCMREGDYANGHFPYASIGGASPVLRLLMRSYTTGASEAECEWQHLVMQGEPRSSGTLGTPNPRIYDDDDMGTIRRATTKHMPTGEFKFKAMQINKA